MVLPSGRLVGTVVGAALLLVVGLSQLVLGRHYPSDLLAGWLWAIAWITFLGLLRHRLPWPAGNATPLQRL